MDRRGGLVNRLSLVALPRERTPMTKKDMAKVIAEELGLPISTVKEVVQRVFDGIIKVLVQEGRIELRDFGVFEVKKRKARQARNPRTGESVSVPERMAIKFKPGTEM